MSLLRGDRPVLPCRGGPNRKRGWSRRLHQTGRYAASRRCSNDTAFGVLQSGGKFRNKSTGLNPGCSRKQPLQWRARLPADHRCLTCPECLRTAQFHGPITDLPSLPRYLHLKFGPNQVNVTVVEIHNALPICNSEYAIAGKAIRTCRQQNEGSIAVPTIA
jgi:hypothetical protein